MCTVTYFPLGPGFVVTHNRDEAPARGAHGLFRVRTASDTLLMPRDPEARGTWIAASKRGFAACLLNGAFTRHERQPPYRRSRGLVLLDLFEFASPDTFWQQYALHGIEPFTLLVFAENRVGEYRWDGRRRYRKDLAPAEPHFWCSATLYPSPMARRRERVFRDGIAAWSATPPGFDPARALLALHRHGTVGDPGYDFVMKRQDRVQTLAITQIVASPQRLRMTYCDLQRDTVDGRILRVPPAHRVQS
jgi:hypothetical protein